MNGFIHSIESFGTVDGPGVRFVVFMQGCPMRCRYCHNPDTWEIGTGTEISADELMARFNKNREFYRNGGITVTGGEPLLQVNFLIEFFALAKAEGINTCIDTSGIVFNEKNHEKLDELMKLTDLVMLDIKHIDSEKHHELTGFGNENILAFAKYLDEKHIPLWIRHVVVPTITDNPVYLADLGKFMAGLSDVKALDVLPYHTMGIAKYNEMGLSYPLNGIPQADKAEALKAKGIILNSFKESRK